MSTRTCGVQGCSQRQATGLPTCRPCWRLAPEPLRDAMWAAYRNSGVKSGRYARARDKLLTAVMRARA